MSRTHRSPGSETSTESPKLKEPDSERSSAGPSNQSMMEQMSEYTTETASWLSGMWSGSETEQESVDIEGPELREKHAGTEWARVEGGEMFVKGEGDETAIHGNDVAQGALGDCYFIASMMAVANVSPETIEKLLTDNGDGTYDITLHLRNDAGEVEPTVVTVDGRLAGGDEPIYAELGDGKEMWPALIEKAMAQHVGSYQGMTGGNINDSLTDYEGALEILTGVQENYHSTAGMEEDEALKEIQAALEGGKAIRVGTRKMDEDPEMTEEANAKNVYGNHAYVPSSVDMENRTISLLNPWGSSHVEDLSIADFLKYYDNYRVTDKPLKNEAE